MSFAEYQQSQRVCYLDLPEWGLFKTFDGQTGTWQFRWDRCQYALGQRVQLEVHHDAECKFATKDDAHRRMSCECPMQAKVHAFLWLVDPRHLEVAGEAGEGDTPIRHGEPPAAYRVVQAVGDTVGWNGCT